jgi:DNA-binding IclR family transcriptional regulator
MNNGIPSEKYQLRTVDRAISILKVFLHPYESSELSLAEISRLVDLSQSTTLRLLVSLRSSGLVEQVSSNGKYRLGVTCLALGDAFLRNNDLRQTAYEFMVRLRDQCGETIHLAFLERSEVVYLDKLAGLHPIGLMSSRAGSRAPAYCTALGKSMLAFLQEADLQRALQCTTFTRYTQNTITDPETLRMELDRVRAQGYAIDDQEHEPGAGCLASPIFGHRGIAASISVSGPAERVLNDRNREELARLVLSAAREVTQRLGGESYTRSDLSEAGGINPFSRSSKGSS